MAITLGWIVLGCLIALAVMQSIYVWLHCRFVLSPPQTANDFQPQIAVLLCLRGRDPSLADCLKGLVNQDYDSFSIHVIVDHEHDLALEDARNFSKQAAGRSFAFTS